MRISFDWLQKQKRVYHFLIAGDNMKNSPHTKRTAKSRDKQPQADYEGVITFSFEIEFCKRHLDVK